MAHYLSPLFEPRSIAVFGASSREGSVGAQVYSNLSSGGFAGKLYPINPKYQELAGRPCFAGLREIGASVDLVLIATPLPAVLPIVRECAEQGVKVVVVLTAGFGETGEAGARQQQAMVEIARRSGMQILGPNCLGFISSKSKVNATFANATIKPGSLALISQSGALCTAILDWAEEVGIGFSQVVSIGDAADIGFGELLDYLATDPTTSAILLYVEGIHGARRFMSGLRVAARLKPTIVLKAGRQSEGARAARSHSGALIGADDVFDAALRRAGVVRVDTIGQLFAASRLLAAGHRMRGNRLAIVSNAGGPAVMAADRAAQHRVQLATLNATTLSRLDALLPAHWSHSNPVDILGDAGPERYQGALEACLADEQVDGVLVMLTPQAMTRPLECAQVVAALVNSQPKPIVACWMGGRQVKAARDLFTSRGVPAFNTPEASIDAFHHLWGYRENQRLLLQAPSPATYEAHHDSKGARMIIESALGERRTLLDTVESKAVLSAFGIPCTIPVRAATAEEALLVAENLGFPVALKLDSRDITHKTDVGGIRLSLQDGAAVRDAFHSLVQEATQRQPDAKVRGVTVERMHVTRHGRELMIGVVPDPCFGPALTVGAGGTLVELIRDRAVGLPPLNSFIAHDMLERTAVTRQLGVFRGSPPANLRAIEEVLSRVSDLVCEVPEILELDINPLIADENGAIAADARIILRRGDPGARPYAHMAIRPYPEELSSDVVLANGATLIIRPIRPEDAQIEQAFVRSLSPRSKYFRFMQTLNELTPEMLIRFTQIDYDREMAFIAVTRAEPPVEVGVSRYVTKPDGKSCEFALVVADEWQGRGVGTRLMKALFTAARAHGLLVMDGEIRVDNVAMLKLVQNLGFTLQPHPDDPSIMLGSKML